MIVYLTNDLGLLFAFICGLFCYNNLNNFFKTIWLLIAVTVLAEIIGITCQFLRVVNTGMYNVVDIIWLTVLLGITFRLLRHVHKGVKIFIAVSAGLVLAANIYSAGLVRYHNWFFVYSGLMIVIVFMLLVFEIAAYSQSNIFHNPLYWFSLGSIFYYGATIPLFCVYNYVLNNNIELTRLLMTINLVGAMIYYIVTGISFIMFSRNAHQKLLPGRT